MKCTYTITLSLSILSLSLSLCLSKFLCYLCTLCLLIPSLCLRLSVIHVFLLSSSNLSLSDFFLLTIFNSFFLPVWLFLLNVLNIYPLSSSLSLSLFLLSMSLSLPFSLWDKYSCSLISSYFSLSISHQNCTIALQFFRSFCLSFKHFMINVYKCFSSLSSLGLRESPRELIVSREKIECKRKKKDGKIHVK